MDEMNSQPFLEEKNPVIPHNSKDFCVLHEMIPDDKKNISLAKGRMTVWTKQGEDKTHVGYMTTSYSGLSVVPLVGYALKELGLFRLLVEQGNNLIDKSDWLKKYKNQAVAKSDEITKNINTRLKDTFSKTKKSADEAYVRLKKFSVTTKGAALKTFLSLVAISTFMYRFAEPTYKICNKLGEVKWIACYNKDLQAFTIRRQVDKDPYEEADDQLVSTYDRYQLVLANETWQLHATNDAAKAKSKATTMGSFESQEDESDNMSSDDNDGMSSDDSYGMSSDDSYGMSSDDSYGMSSDDSYGSDIVFGQNQSGHGFDVGLNGPEEEQEDDTMTNIETNMSGNTFQPTAVVGYPSTFEKDAEYNMWLDEDSMAMESAVRMKVSEFSGWETGEVLGKKLRLSKKDEFDFQVNKQVGVPRDVVALGLYVVRCQYILPFVFYFLIASVLGLAVIGAVKLFMEREIRGETDE